MVTRGGERRRQALKDVGVIVEHRRGLTVHQVGRADDVAAEGMADGLMPQTNPQQRLFAGEGFDYIARYASFDR